MHIFESSFVTGAIHPDQFPPETFPELAFAGRSNVGKSSLLNRLLNRKALARVSGTPGCTRLIHFYQVNRRWLFVDLPGYGYAKVSHSQHAQWEREMARYLAGRRALRAVVVLLDPRRGVTDLDQRMMTFLDESGVGYLPVATKIDKLNMSERTKSLRAMEREIHIHGKLSIGNLVACSSHTGAGLEQLWKRLGPILGEEGMDAEEGEVRAGGDSPPAPGINE